MIVIIEGPDNAGKTTLALRVAKLLKGIYVKNEDLPPKDSFALENYHFLLLAAQRMCDWVITDRHLAISDPIYGPICRGGTPLNQAEIDRCLTSAVRVIYCRPPDGCIFGSLSDREQMEGVVKNAKRLVKAYDDFFHYEPIGKNRLPFHFTTYDYTQESPELVAAWLKGERG